MENIWGADPADIPLISKFSERIPFLLSYWYLWQTCMDYSLKRQKKELQLLIIFKKIYMNQTANQMKYGLIILGSEFYNISIESFLQNNNLFNP